MSFEKIFKFKEKKNKRKQKTEKEILEEQEVKLKNEIIELQNLKAEIESTEHQKIINQPVEELLCTPEWIEKYNKHFVIELNRYRLEEAEKTWLKIEALKLDKIVTKVSTDFAQYLIDTNQYAHFIKDCPLWAQPRNRLENWWFWKWYSPGECLLEWNVFNFPDWPTVITKATRTISNILESFRNSKPHRDTLMAQFPNRVWLGWAVAPKNPNDKPNHITGQDIMFVVMVVKKAYK